MDVNGMLYVFLVGGLPREEASEFSVFVSWVMVWVVV